MKNLKSIIGLTLVFFASFGFTACSDEDGDIYFTQDEIIQGDIATGKQIPLPGNAISVYATMGNSVNVQNASGAISAVSKDESIATARIVDASMVIVVGVQIGETQIVVSDADGKTATLNVKVEDINLYWYTIYTYKKISLVEDVVEIEGADDAARGYIINDILCSKGKERTFTIKGGSSFPSSVYKMQVSDKDGNILYELPNGTLSASGYTFYIPYVSNGQVEDAKKYSFHEETDSFGTWLVEDISDDYKAQYPDVKVLLKMQVERK